MSFRQWMEASYERIERDGIGGIGPSIREFVVEGRRRVVRKTLRSVPGPEGTNVFEKDWDVLVLLDCARPDFFDSLQSEYDFLHEGDTLTSVGSSSSEWVANTFVPEYADEMADTVYVTANPHSPEIENSDWLRGVEEVWRDGWDEDEGTVPARAVTDRAVSVARNESFDRLLVHYMQPHPPFVGYDDVAVGGMTRPGEDADEYAFDKAFRMGRVSFERAWEAHVRNLEYVLEDVALLRENVSADTFVISADHGQALGEYFVAGHPDGIPIAVLREVPWIETDATDRGTHEPAASDARAESEESIDEKLRALGYRE